jgi:hypothetical protein
MPGPGVAVRPLFIQQRFALFHLPFFPFHAPHCLACTFSSAICGHLKNNIHPKTKYHEKEIMGMLRRPRRADRLFKKR